MERSAKVVFGGTLLLVLIVAALFLLLRLSMQSPTSPRPTMPAIEKSK